jgi:hypothetical protein
MGHVIAFPRPHGAPDHRQGPDQPGYAPLVLIIDADEDSNSRCEAILARLHFAVAPTRSIEEATRVMEALRPNLIVARIADAAALRQATGADVPVVLLADDLLDPELLVEEIRRELRARAGQT